MDSQGQWRWWHRGAGGESAMNTLSRVESRESRAVLVSCKALALDPRPSALDPRSGMMLIDCLAYIALLALILTMAFAAFYRANDYSRELSRNTADITRALQAGERWRA